ncbi:glycosyl-transferase for dystroglycan-domain-containing protein [Gigaspora margarita]|uniref:Glycosyl-transferase for dystroglycan-domain-containing protein n=2 Tax=Gigaspora margarita TaxID=4874 RepID=A0A8H4ADX1_GIGMA|nr:glycosyl-transferase for dystroglycan-domain-containing protein [Gigaspora margarita]
MFEQKIVSRILQHFISLLYRRRLVLVCLIFSFPFLFFRTPGITLAEIRNNFRVESLVNISLNKVQICNDNNIISFLEPKYWKESDLQKEHIYHNIRTIHVPVGMNVVLVTQDDKRLSIPMGFTNCTGQEFCNLVARLDISADLRLALEQIAEFNENNIQELIHHHKSKLHFFNHDVTLVSQFSVNRLERFEQALAAWPGPVSVVIYLTNPHDIYTLIDYFQMDKNIYLYNRVSLTIIKPNYSTDYYLKYPINQLRNIGIKTAPTDYIFVMDADFVPTSRLYHFAFSTLIPLLKQSSHPTAFVVPCVALLESYRGKFPYTIPELRSLFRQGIAYITDPNSGHGPTGTNIFLAHQLYTSLPYYEVCYESQWEPYYIISKNAPLYDERFRNQGGDKQQHAFSLNALGYRFFVLKEHFIYHKDHPKIDWPDGGLRHGQLSKNQFNYFQHYIPEMQSIFGINVRWPRGCSQPLITGQMRDLLGIGIS